MKFDIKKYGLKEKWGVSQLTINKIQQDVEAEFEANEIAEMEKKIEPSLPFVAPKKNGNRL